jgi:hypothetical protein
MAALRCCSKQQQCQRSNADDIATVTAAAGGALVEVVAVVCGEEQVVKGFSSPKNMVGWSLSGAFVSDRLYSAQLTLKHSTHLFIHGVESFNSFGAVICLQSKNSHTALASVILILGETTFSTLLRAVRIRLPKQDGYL